MKGFLCQNFFTGLRRYRPFVRDEGIYKTPNEKKKEIYDAYIWLTGEISKLKKHNKINN